MPRFVKQSAIDAPARAVFAWHQRPDALAQLTPPWERVTIVRAAPSLAEGGRAEILLHMGPLRLRWVAEHRGFIDRGDKGGEGGMDGGGGEFTDVQIKGPFHRWEHRHIVEADGANRCVLRDEVTYELPFGALGRVFSGALARRRLERMFEYRHAVTRRAAETGEAGETADTAEAGETGEPTS